MEVVADSAEGIKSWSGYIESKLRKLVECLEYDDGAGLEIAHPCARRALVLRAACCAAAPFPRRRVAR